MSGSNDRFGRRSAKGDKSPAEPVLSFTPRNEAKSDALHARDDGDGRAAPRLGRSAKKAGPTIEAADRPLHLSEDASRGGSRIFGWVALVAVLLAVGGVYAWHVYTPTPSAPVQGYTTPPQPGSNTADTSAGNPPPAQSLGAAGQVTTPSATSPAATTPPNEPAAQSVATAPTPKSLPATPPEPPRKTISDAAAAHPLTTTTPPSVAPVPPKHDDAKRDETKHEAVKHDAAKPEPPRKDASLELPQPLPKPAASAEPPMPTLPPPARHATVTPPAAPSMPVPQTFSGPAASGRPLPLTGAATPANPSPDQNQNTAAAVAPTPSLVPLLHPPAPPANGTPVPGTNTVTVNGVTYVNGEQPHALGSLSEPAPAATSAPTPLAPTPAAPSAPATTPYLPPSNSAPLPNDVIIGPNGQMTVPTGQQ
jgi:hypothetical protein